MFEACPELREYEPRTRQAEMLQASLSTGVPSIMASNAEKVRSGSPHYTWKFLKFPLNSLNLNCCSPEVS